METHACLPAVGLGACRAQVEGCGPPEGAFTVVGGKSRSRLICGRVGERVKVFSASAQAWCRGTIIELDADGLAYVSYSTRYGMWCKCVDTMAASEVRSLPQLVDEKTTMEEA